MGAAKKYAYDLSLPEKKIKLEKKESFKLIKNKKNKNLSKSNRAALIFSTLLIFSMFLIITYRYNLISEKNLEVQKLKKELEVAKSELATTQIAVDKAMDVVQVEAYAKQQLGMQKPEKSQLIYINMENEESVKKMSAANMISCCLEKVKEIVNNIF
ncbi:MAG: hypothetical protein PHR25_04465 [Clostridia bacterium]|nr:hypothetical protein [Clostridia bacterium]MDD4376017.1 hypothetical protein [Clostridia bacterium]